jgi:hypothetical protein
MRITEPRQGYIYEYWVLNILIHCTSVKWGPLERLFNPCYLSP